MVQLRVLAGSSGAPVYFIRRFPSVIGRSHTADLVLEYGGVWDQHAELSLEPASGFQIKSCPNALTLINGTSIDQPHALRNGDVIDIGSVKLQFWLAEAPQRNFRIREALTWTGLGIICAGQIALIYWLLH